MVSIRVQSLTFSDGNRVEIPANGLIVFVGPNNAGKSQALVDIDSIMRTDAPTAVVTTAEIAHEEVGDEAVRDWIRTNFRTIKNPGLEATVGTGQNPIPVEAIVNQWREPRLGNVGEFFIRSVNAGSRLNLVSNVQAIDPEFELPTSPMTRAAEDRELEEGFSDLFFEAFGSHLVLDKYSGRTLRFRIGERLPFEADDRGPTHRYLTELRSRAALERQGDGIKSYMGLVMEVMLGAQQILLVDEPEAFLHPPQARLLGRRLGNLAQTKQVFVATHSLDFLLGCLDSRSTTTIIRLTRNGNINHAFPLDHDSLGTLWADPLLRSSRLLNGVFHEGAFVCEGDSDCKYYSMMWEGPMAQGEARRPDYFFVASAGKGRIGRAMGALRALGVPTLGIVDFDFLFEWSSVWAALHGAVDEGETQVVWQKVNLALGKSEIDLNKESVAEILQDVLEKAADPLSSSDLSLLLETLKSKLPKELAKGGGLKGMPDEESRAAAIFLMAKLRTVGVQVVPTGELESHEPDIKGKRGAWIARVVEAGRDQNPGPSAAIFLGQLEAAAVDALRS